MADPFLSVFPADSRVPPRLLALVEGKGPERVRVKMEEAGYPSDPRRKALADFTAYHDLQVYFDPFADIWTISRNPKPDLFSETSHA